MSVVALGGNRADFVQELRSVLVLSSTVVHLDLLFKNLLLENIVRL